MLSLLLYLLNAGTCISKFSKVKIVRKTILKYLYEKKIQIKNVIIIQSLRKRKKNIKLFNLIYP